MLEAAAAINGWKLLLMALLGGYVVERTGAALGNIIHGAPPLVSVKDSSATLTPAAAGPAKVSGVAGVDGIDVAEVDDLAEVFAGTYGALPPEVIAGLPGAPRGDLQIGGHPAAWAAGIVAAAAAVAVIAWRTHPGGIPAVDVHADPVKAHVDPVEVKPIAVQPDLSKVQVPDLSKILPGGGALPGGGHGGGGAPALQPQAQQLAQGLASFLGGGAQNAGG